MSNYKLAENIEYDLVEKNAIAVNTETGEYFELNQTALAILQFIKLNLEESEIINKLVEKYPNNQTQIKEDVDSVIKFLLDHKIITANL